MLRSLATLIMIAIFASFAIRSNYAAMLMYWWFSVFRPQDVMFWDIASLRIPLMAGLLFAFSSIANRSAPNLKNTQGGLMVAIMVLAVLAESAAGCDNAQDKLNIAYLAIFMVTVWMTEPLLTTDKRILGILVTVALSLNVLTAKSGLHALVTGGSLYGIKIGSGSFTGTNAAAMGTVQAIFFLILLLQCISGKSGKSYLPNILHSAPVRTALVSFIWVILIGSIYFVIATRSRGSALAMGLGFFVWVLLHPKRIRILIAIAILLVAASPFYTIPQSYKDRIASSFVESDQLDNSASSRSHFWLMGKNMADDHLFGVGVGCYPYYYNSYDTTNGEHGQWRSVHSSHFAIISELGYIGLALWVLLFASSFLKLMAVRRHSRHYLGKSSNSRFYFNLCNALIASQCAFLLGGSFYSMAYNYFVWLVFAITIAVGRLYLGGISTRDVPEPTQAESFNQSDKKLY